ncbi:hypothetical protein CEXT_665841 [Caerostris extrusa]|uniref:Uncharacterized protein n=1 Tax=Caerostris extrusa TaxID=172846 RepID=A0AAV4MBJ2_CAEEX|nr:hypothetical protein CEXT_665841 [Caerostris extrusa]
MLGSRIGDLTWMRIREALRCELKHSFKQYCVWMSAFRENSRTNGNSSFSDHRLPGERWAAIKWARNGIPFIGIVQRPCLEFRSLRKLKISLNPIASLPTESSFLLQSDSSLLNNRIQITAATT